MKVFLYKHYKAIFVLVFIGLSLVLSNVFGAVVYERTPAGLEITNPVSFSFSFDDYDDFASLITDCQTQTCTDWGVASVRCTAKVGNTCTNGEQLLVASCVPLTETSHTFVVNILEGDYYGVVIVANDDIDPCSAMPSGEMIEYNGDKIIFSVLSPPPPSYNIIPLKLQTEFTTSTLAYVGRLFTDLQNAIFLIIGLPLGFWGVAKVISVIGGGIKTKS